MSRSPTTGAPTDIADSLPVEDIAPATIRVIADCGVFSEQSGESASFPDSAFELLAHPGRRIVITHLLSAGPTVTLSELLDYVFSQSDTGTESQSTRKEVTQAFTNRHLPKLESDGYVSYDMERQRITATDQTGMMKPYIVLALIHEQGEVFDQGVTHR